ncbi:hypothetical protein BURK1_00496 [Burkholderiales bacterium]|nr:hypothetical protein BURK1_00496 [Burkholderiales bacterium]
MNDFDHMTPAGCRRGASTGNRLSIASGPASTAMSRRPTRADGPGMNDRDRRFGPETMR